MRPLPRVAAAGLVVAALAGGVALRPAAAATPQHLSTPSSPHTTPRTTPHTTSAAATVRTQRVAHRHVRASSTYQRPATLEATALRMLAPVRETPRHHHATVAGTVRETYLQRGNRLLSTLHFDYQALGYRIHFFPDKPGLLGYTDPQHFLISIYVRSSESDLVLRHSIAHELGHALDYAHGGGAKRQDYLTLRNVPTSIPWFGATGQTDFGTPAGDWAECFADWLAGPGDFRSTLAPAPSKAELAELAQLFTSP